MVIVDENTNKSLDNVTILLSATEASQMIGYLEALLSNSTSTQNVHYHLNNDDYSKEITLTLYDKKESLEHFAEKYRTLIRAQDS